MALHGGMSCDNYMTSCDDVIHQQSWALYVHVYVHVPVLFSYSQSSGPLQYSVVQCAFMNPLK